MDELLGHAEYIFLQPQVLIVGQSNTPKSANPTLTLIIDQNLWHSIIWGAHLDLPALVSFELLIPAKAVFIVVVKVHLGRHLGCFSLPRNRRRWLEISRIIMHQSNIRINRMQNQLAGFIFRPEVVTAVVEAEDFLSGRFGFALFQGCVNVLKLNWISFIIPLLFIIKKMRIEKWRTLHPNVLAALELDSWGHAETVWLSLGRLVTFLDGFDLNELIEQLFVFDAECRLLLLLLLNHFFETLQLAL